MSHRIRMEQPRSWRGQELARMAAAAFLAVLAGSAGALGASQGASGAVSENLVFEEIPVVITASRHEQKMSEAPATVAVITAEEIERQGYRTLAEALQNAPGLYINYDHNYTYIGVRGFARPGDYNSRVQIQLNGHPMNDSIWDYAGTGEDQGVDIHLVERIEIVYGPSSAMYGSNALFATINVITKSASDLPGAQLGLEAGTFGRGKALMSYGGEKGGWKLLAGGSFMDSKGDELFFPEYDALGQNNGIAKDTDFEDAYRFFGRASKGNWSVQASHSYRVKGIPTGAFLTLFNDDATRSTDVRSLAELQYRRPLSSRVDLAVRGSYNEYRYWGVYRYDGGGFLVDNIDRSTGRWLSQEAQIGLRLSPRHRFTFGQVFVRNFEAEVENFDENPKFVYTDVSDSYSENSVYAQHEFRPAQAWSLTTGLRYDDYSTFGSAFSPRFGAIFAPSGTWRVKAMAGRAFRAPNFYELYWEGPTGMQAGVGNLDPEQLTSYELTLESNLGSRSSGQLTVYMNRIRDLISQVEIAPGIYQFQNVDHATTSGMELALRTRFANGVRGSFSYALMNAEDRDGRDLSNFPPHSYKLGVSIPFANERWWLSSNMQFYDERITLASTRSPDYLLVNLTLLAPLFHPKVRLSASVYNLFDKQYGLPASAEHQDLVLIPQDRRNLAVRLACKF